ncbi:amidase family protein, partial [Streptomyces spectabilis]|uniref:amidase family protein n=1 Tax=Streptomyces spectabilis TaxID=68270 RepID=UPI00340160FC
MFTERIFQTAEELMAALRAGEVSSAELTDEAIARIERDDTAVNAICVPDFDRARAAARDADEARARGEDRPLLGLPVTVKESFDMAGLPTTWGMPPHRDFVPAEDAVPDPFALSYSPESTACAALRASSALSAARAAA